MPAANPTVVRIPDFRIQHDWQRDLAGGTFWVSSSTKSGETVHGHIKVIPAAGGVLDFFVEPFSVLEHSTLSGSPLIRVSNPDGDQVTFRAPIAQFDKLHPVKGIYGIDISVGGGLGVSCSRDSLLRVWETNDGSLRRDLIGHKGDVNICRFFPSGKVVLSGGADCVLKIWDIDTGDCAADLKGHTGGILGAAMIDKGKNLISCARDGKAHLWDCGTQEILATYDASEKAVNGVAIDNKPYSDKAKVMVLACEDSMIRGYNIEDATEVFEVPVPAAANAINVTDNVVTCGCDDGSIVETDLRKPTTNVLVFKRSNAPVLSVSQVDAHSPKQTLICTGDGTCFIFDRESNKVSQDFTGPDYEPVYNAKFWHSPEHAGGGLVYSCSRDGVIRKYSVPY
eukprot:CAMPEP_0184675862 /NCGR_PEP_ID=MMETSP0308-20130426/88039_1 /TAXON_ID=38269 /ORGANISM="Gloeochaete witrockiana, Strain SAG 46.84" /LENGTH=395 /DNA_ID=CAMNT_0027123643 /DNA_START=97 /DNA_END=1284 /DNA_ORIENTATION=+